MILETEIDLASAREAVTKRVLSARRLPDILEAQQVLRAWIQAHPEDEGMRDGFEQLSLMQDIAEEELAVASVTRELAGLGKSAH